MRGGYYLDVRHGDGSSDDTGPFRRFFGQRGRWETIRPAPSAVRGRCFLFGGVQLTEDKLDPAVMNVPRARDLGAACD